MSYVLWDVVDEQLDEAELLWERWEECSVSPRYSPASLARGPEERLFAVIDALASAGPSVASKRLVPALAEGGPRASAAALALLDSGRDDEVMRALALGESAASIGRALDVSCPPGAAAALAATVDRVDAAPAARAVAIDVLAARGELPLHALGAVSPNDDPALVDAVMRATRIARDRGAIDRVGEALAAPALRARGEVLVTALALGHTGARAACIDAASGAHGEVAREALLLQGMSADPRAIDDLVAALARPEIAPFAIVALGASGRPAAAEACLPLLGDAALGKLAGEAFVTITGLPIAPPYLGAPLPGDDGSEAPIPVAELLLPRLDAKATEGFWSAERARFDRKKRYLGGAIMSGEVVHKALAEGSMRGRIPLAIEVAIRSGAAINLPLRAPARRWIEAVREVSITSIDFQSALMER